MISNSDAALDLGERAQSVTPALASCLSVPLTSGDALIGVLTLYAPGRNAFNDDHGRLVQMIAPHVAQALARAERRQAGAAVPINRDLRVVAS
jgi:GAF domain-containing protein